MIKNPVSDHLPPGCPRITTSFSAGEAVCPRTLVPEGPAAVVIGAFAHGAVRNGSTLRLIHCFQLRLSVLQISLSFIRWMWTTQRRLCQSVTTRCLQHWPVPRCALPSRRCGVSCDKQFMDYWWDSKLRGHFFNGLRVDMTETLHQISVSPVRPRGLQTCIQLCVCEYDAVWPPCGTYIKFVPSPPIP